MFYFCLTMKEPSLSLSLLGWFYLGFRISTVFLLFVAYGLIEGVEDD